MANSVDCELAAWVPPPGRSLSKRFYERLGFARNWEEAGLVPEGRGFAASGLISRPRGGRLGRNNLGLL
jgi:hypothetical protein